MDGEESEFWTKLREAFKRKFGREMEFDDVCKLWGGGPMGQSQDTGRRDPQSLSADDGIKDQT
jgi:hypothetical protein